MCSLFMAACPFDCPSNLDITRTSAVSLRGHSLFQNTTETALPFSFFGRRAQGPPLLEMLFNFCRYFDISMHHWGMLK